MLIASSIILVVSYILIAWEKIPKVTVAILGAAIMLVLSHTPAEKVFAHVDFSVIFLLVSMMIIVHITARSGVFKWLALEMVKKTGGNLKLIMVSLAIFTAFFSAFLDNVTTVVLILPIVFAVTRTLKIDPIPYLITIILASNIGGAATLIGDPPNIIIGNAAGLSFMDFVRELTFVIIFIFIISMSVLLFMFRKSLSVPDGFAEKLETIDNSRTIKDKKHMIRSVSVLMAVITGFLLNEIIHIDAYIIALLGAGILMLFETPKQIIHEVEWTTIFFFIGLFLIVGGFAEAGGIKLLADNLLKITSGDLKLTSMLILWASGIFSAIVDNIPYTATVVPLINQLKSSMDVYPLWWSLSLGACLGGNATIIGAAANVIVIETAHAAGHNISFWRFFKYGFVITVISLLISTLFIYLRFFL
ncbi:MAG: ArsB/NhaD family transporter [Candidatus Gastranaerophilales bacterium]|nr:ArsB/NhaD family transporter [Candidatus Gastranaerophilales bacterium]